jgi:outer membrane protein assembly factor BamB
MKRREWVRAAAGMVLQRLTRAQSSEPAWPQWRGPKRNGISAETGLAGEWPTGGPKLLWSIKDLGDGYGTVSLAGNRLYVQGGKGRQSVAHALNRADGAVVWTTPIGAEVSDSRGDGPRSTPTLNGERLYVLTEAGDLACLAAADGAVVWRKNILKEFHGHQPHWLISESPLIDGENVIVTPGGRGASIVALNKATGETVWASSELHDGAGYSSCVVMELGEVRAITTLSASAGVGVRASDGKLLWRYERPANRTANIATPVFRDNKVFYTSAYGTGGGLLTLTAKADSVTTEETYFTTDMQNHHGGVILDNGYLYGFSNAILTCIEFETGKVQWKDRSVGKGSLTLADGRLYLLSEGNVAGLAEVNPKEYIERGRFEIPDQGLPSWAHPVVCGGKLYIRNQSLLNCYDVKA